jgi:poly(A) polymerase
MLKEKAIEIVKAIQSHGKQAVFAGGCVRDMILNQIPHDYDIATNAKPEEIESYFNKTIPIGKAFGIITVEEDGDFFEVATFRNDGIYEDNRHPSSIEFSSMEEDAKRRDFTINGMFFDPCNNKLYDFVGGKEDIEKKIIRFIGNAEDRIKEDALRIMRAFRFSAKIGFEIDNDSLVYIKKHIDLLKNVSIERIREELGKILILPSTLKVLNLMQEVGFFREILPEVDVLKGCEQNQKFHPEGDVWNHTIIALDKLQKKTIINCFSTFFHDIGKPLTLLMDDNGVIHNYGHEFEGANISLQILTRMKFSNAEINYITGIIYDHMAIHQVTKMKNSTFLKYARKEYFDDLLEVSKADSLSSGGSIGYIEYALKRKERLLTQKRNKIAGKYLIDMGLKPGKVFQVILEKVNGMIEDNLLTSKEEIDYTIQKTYKENQ